MKTRIISLPHYFLISIILLASFINPGCTQSKDKNQLKYVFYLVGDGMGLAQASAAEVYLSALNNKIGFDKLNLSKLDVQSFKTTYSNNDFITCSSASGTAFATGYKTNNGVLSLSPDLSDTLTSIAEKAKANGMKVGIVTSVSLDHATPAVFYAHSESRNHYYDISMQIGSSGFDFFGGGGLRYPEGVDPENDKNAIEFAQENGYQFVNTTEDFKLLSPSANKVLAISPILSGGRALRYAIDQTDEDISLADFTSKAIELLDNNNGFFLMVEGGKIDWACHDNDAATVVQEVLDFDEAVGEALNFYEKHPDETLILVFADHETGGMGLGTDGMNQDFAYALLDNQQCSNGVLSKEIDLFIEKNGKSTDFKDVMRIVTEKTGLGNEGLELNSLEKQQLEEAFLATINKSNQGSDLTKSLYGGNNPLAITAVKMLGNKAGIGWTTFHHSAIPVPIRAIGVGADQFGGYIDNTDIPKITEELLGF